MGTLTLKLGLVFTDCEGKLLLGSSAAVKRCEDTVKCFPPSSSDSHRLMCFHVEAEDYRSSQRILAVVMIRLYYTIVHLMVVTT